MPFIKFKSIPILFILDLILLPPPSSSLFLPPPSLHLHLPPLIPSLFPLVVLLPPPSSPSPNFLLIPPPLFILLWFLFLLILPPPPTPPSSTLSRAPFFPPLPSFLPFHLLPPVLRRCPPLTCPDVVLDSTCFSLFYFFSFFSLPSFLR